MEKPNEPEIIADPAANVDPEVNKDPKDPIDPSQNDPKDPKDPKETKPFSRRERLLHSKEKIEKQLEELDDEEDDNRPATIGDLKKMKQEETRKSSIDLASSITDEDERNQVIDLLTNRIIPSGDPQKDFEFARSSVNSDKNIKIAEEIGRKTPPNQTGSKPGAPGEVEEVFIPTDSEAYFMKNFRLTKEDVLKARRETAAARTE